jgi:GxxExxY protein
MDYEEAAKRTIGAAIKVHRLLGPGMLENSYEVCLAQELFLQGIACERQKVLPLNYKGVHLDAGYRLDLLVEDCLIVEVKAVESFAPVHKAQVITYLKLTGLKLGLLLNFNVDMMRWGIKRVIL